MTTETTQDSSDMQNATVLVIDDERVTRITVARILSKLSYHVIEAENGEDGVASAMMHKPDIILLDVVMPGMDGFETCRLIREFSTPNSLPIIMLTGLNDSQSVDQAFLAGATDFINKPINWTILGQRVKYALRSKILNSELLNNQQRLQQAYKIARLGYWESVNSGKDVECSDELLDVLGIEHDRNRYALQEMLGLVHDDDRQYVSRSIANIMLNGGSAQIEHMIVRPDRSTIHALHLIETISSGMDNGTRIMGIIQDISWKKEAEHLIEYQRFHDPVTNIPNKAGFLEKLQEYTSDSRADDTMFAVFFLGIDRYDTFINTLGHDISDQLVTQVANRLRSFEDIGFYIARYRDDIFALITPKLQNLDEASEQASRIVEKCSESYHLGTQELHTGSSIGISIFPIDSTDPATIIKGADSARQRAGSDPSHKIQYFSDKLNQLAQERLLLEKEMRNGLRHGEFEVYYQPQVDIVQNAVIGMEALVRWNHPEKGLISPFHFIPIAEETGMITELGEQVLRKACKQTAEWSRQGLGALRVGVNLSLRQFAGNDLYLLVSEILAETGLPASQLDLEITESMVASDINAVVDILNRLKDLGVSISMDDFGTGYSALAFLKQLPLDILKVDRSFVMNIGNGDNGNIARAIVAMAHSMGLSVITEGVETEEQYQVICATGSNEIQGYYFSPPIPAAKFRDYVLSHNRHAGSSQSA